MKVVWFVQFSLSQNPHVKSLETRNRRGALPSDGDGQGSHESAQQMVQVRSRKAGGGYDEIVSQWPLSQLFRHAGRKKHDLEFNEVKGKMFLCSKVKGRGTNRRKCATDEHFRCRQPRNIVWPESSSHPIIITCHHRPCYFSHSFSVSLPTNPWCNYYQLLRSRALLLCSGLNDRRR